MANLQRLKTVLEKMKAVGALHIVIEASKEPASAVSIGQLPANAASSAGKARLRMVAEAELVSIATTFPALALVMEGKRGLHLKAQFGFVFLCGVWSKCSLLFKW